MKEGIEFNGTFGKRLQKLMDAFSECIGIKRIYVGSDEKINLTILFNGDDAELERLRIFLKSNMPTEENCMVFIKNTNPEKDFNVKIELIDIMVSK